MDQQGTSVRKLYRSRKERVIAGVCGGVAEYFNIDPVWVRIGWVLAIFIKGLGLVAYALCWILIPEREWSAAPSGDSSPEGSAGGQALGATGTGAGAGAGAGAAAGAGAGPGEATGSYHGGSPRSSPLSLSGSQPHVVIGVVLIALGCIFGLLAFVPFISSDAFWAMALILVGVGLLARR